MHKFLRAVGFSKIRTKAEVNRLISEITTSAKIRKYTKIEDETVFAEYIEEIADNIGITIRGSYEQESVYLFDHYFPYIKSDVITSMEDISVERHKDRESYAGICDDARVGVTLIFYLQNVVDYIKIRNSDLLPISGTSLSLTGLSVEGRIMMPIVKDKVEIKQQAVFDRQRLIEAAKNGDSVAIDSLTIDDIETYAILNEKIKREDVYSLVNSYLMPYGVECDMYSVLGEILECSIVNNHKTGETIWKIKMMCKDMEIEICINSIDLLGEPEVGRRFKGVIWLQGYINYPYSFDYS